MRQIKALLIAVCIPLAAEAQTVTLDECQRLAQDNYPLIRQYDLVNRTIGYNLSNISKGWLPQISMMAQATVQSDVMTLPDPLEKMLSQQGYDVQGLGKDQYRIGLDLNQTIYDGGVIRSQKKIVKLEGEIHTAETDVEMYKIRQRVNDIYFGILLLDEKIQLNSDLQNLLQSNVDKISSMLSNGIAMRSDLNTVEAELMKTQQQATELAFSRKSLVDMLSIFIGKVLSDVEEPQSLSVDSSVNNRPELHLYDTKMELVKAQERLLTARLIPKFSFFAQGFYGYPGYDQFDAMFNRDWKLNGMAGIRMVWNLGAAYTNRNDRARLAMQRGLAETARETFLFNSRMLVSQHTDGMDKYSAMIDKDKEILTLRTDVRKAAESKLEHGTVDTNNLLQEITRENQAHIDLSTHIILKLKETYDLKYSINN